MAGVDGLTKVLGITALVAVTSIATYLMGWDHAVKDLARRCARDGVTVVDAKLVRCTVIGEGRAGRKVLSHSAQSGAAQGGPTFARHSGNASTV